MVLLSFVVSSLTLIKSDRLPVYTGHNYKGFFFYLDYLIEFQILITFNVTLYKILIKLSYSFKIGLSFLIIYF